MTEIVSLFSQNLYSKQTSDTFRVMSPTEETEQTAVGEGSQAGTGRG